MTRGRWLAAAAAVAAAVLLARAVAGAAVEYRWYAAFGDGPAAVWRARTAALALLRAAAAAAGGVFVYLNFLGVSSTVDTVVLQRRVGGLDISERVPAARLRWGAVAASLALGMLLAAPLDGWEAVDALVGGRSLGEIEPYTGRDLAFFVHWLPLENALYAWALLVLVVTAAIVIALYAVTPGLRWSDRRLHVSNRVRRHLTVLGVAVLFLLAWGHRLDAYALLGFGSGPEGAFTGADQLGALPARFTLAALTPLAALVVLRAGWAGQARAAFWTVTAIVGSALVVRALAPAVAVRALDARALADADAAAAANRALYTQRAFGVDRLVPAPPEVGIDPAFAAQTVSAWDGPAVARATSAARRTVTEGEAGFQPGAARGGVLAVLVERVAATGAPAGPAPAEGDRTVLLVDAGGADGAGRPVPNGSVPLGDAGRRVRLAAYPGAAGPLYWQGEPAVVGDPLRDWRVRLAHALAGRDLRLAFSGAGDERRLVDHRDVRQRVARLVPFFALDGAVTPLVAGDSLYYAVAFYSASADYPLAQRYGVRGDEWASFRAAGTALVNAQSGAVRLVPAADLDADARAWVARFPGLFTPATAISAELARAIPPPADGARAQAYAFVQFGARGERAPISRQLPARDGGDTALTGQGRGVMLIASMPDIVSRTATIPADRPRVSDDLYPAWTLPLLNATDRIDGVLVAVGGPRPTTWWAPADSTAPRWQELLDDLAANGPDDPSTIVRGRLRAFPVVASSGASAAIAYARPEYRLPSEGAPSLARVVGRTGGVTRVGATAAAALGAAAPADSAAGPPLTEGDRLARARALFIESRDALRRGDWTGVGRALDGLGGALGLPPSSRDR